HERIPGWCGQRYDTRLRAARGAGGLGDRCFIRPSGGGAQAQCRDQAGQQQHAPIVETIGWRVSVVSCVIMGSTPEDDQMSGRLEVRMGNPCWCRKMRLSTTCGEVLQDVLGG